MSTVTGEGQAPHAATNGTEVMETTVTSEGRALHAATNGTAVMDTNAEELDHDGAGDQVESIELPGPCPSPADATSPREEVEPKLEQAEHPGTTRLSDNLAAAGVPSSEHHESKNGSARLDQLASLSSNRQAQGHNVLNPIWTPSHFSPMLSRAPFPPGSMTTSQTQQRVNGLPPTYRRLNELSQTQQQQRVNELSQTQQRVNELFQTQQQRRVNELSQTQQRVNGLPQTQHPVNQRVNDLPQTQYPVNDLPQTQQRVNALSQTQQHVNELTQTHRRVNELSHRWVPSLQATTSSRRDLSGALHFWRVQSDLSFTILDDRGLSTFRREGPIEPWLTKENLERHLNPSNRWDEPVPFISLFDNLGKQIPASSLSCQLAMGLLQKLTVFDRSCQGFRVRALAVPSPQRGYPAAN